MTNPVWQTPYNLSSYSAGSEISILLNAVAVFPATSISSYSVVIGSLPSGLTLTTNGNISGVLSQVLSSSNYNFTVRATDNLGSFTDKTFLMTVTYNPVAPTWITPAGSLGTYPSQISVTITLSAGAVLPATSVSYLLISGTLPDGLTVTDNGIISGIPNLVSETTISTFTIRVTDNLQNISDRTFSIGVNGIASPTFTTPEGSLPATLDSVWYDVPIHYFNPIPSNEVTIRLISGELPIGLELNESGRIRGYAEPPVITITRPLIVTTSDLTTSATNSITCFTVTDVTVGRPVVFSGSVFGGVVAGTTYYVRSVDALTSSITITTTQNGSLFSLDDGSGLMTVSFPAVAVGEPITKTFSFQLKLESLLGDKTNTYSITVYNQSSAPRAPVIYNTRPPTFNLDDSDIYYGYYTLPSQEILPIVRGTAIRTTLSTNYIELDSVVDFQVGRQIIFTGVVFGNIESNVTYYITSVDYNQNLITISTNQNGINLILSSGTGVMNAILPAGPIYDVYPSTGSAFIGKVQSDDYFAFKVIGHDFQGEELNYQFLDVPVGANLTTNLPANTSSNGWITGTPTLSSTSINRFEFSVYTYRVTDPSVRSATVTFSFDVAKNLDGEIIWDSLSDLGNIVNGTISTKKIKVICDTSVSFRITSGSLPPNLVLLSNGEITGYVAYQPTDENLDLNNETIFTFTVEAYSPIYPSIISSKTFTLTVIQEYINPTDTLYIKAAPSFTDREIIDSLLNNSFLIPENYLYRPEDSNFGKATDVIYQHAYGIYASDINQYLEAITKNHYWRNITLGELKTAVAKDEYGNIVYEVVYSEVIDNLVNPAGESLPLSITWPRNISLALNNFYTSVTDLYTSYVFGENSTEFLISNSSSTNNALTCNSTTLLEVGREITFSGVLFGGVTSLTTYYIHSIISPTEFKISLSPYDGSPLVLSTESGSMTANYFEVKYYTSLTPGTARILYPNSLQNMRTRVGLELGQEFDSSILPLWMTSQQSNGSTLGFTQAWVICYTKPGLSQQIVNLINNNWPYKLNQINFQIDRFSVNKSLTYDYDNNLNPPAWTSLPSATPVPNPIDSKDFYVIFPRKTILPNSNQ